MSSSPWISPNTPATSFEPSPSSSTLRPSTRAIIGSASRLRPGAPLVASIVQSATFVQSEPGRTTEHTYSRASNPTVTALEERLGAFEDALPGLSFSSGLAATHALALARLSTGDHAIVGAASYGGTIRLFAQLLRTLGIRTTFVDATEVTAIRAAVEPRTRLILVETPANPTLVLADLAAIAEVARAAGVTFAVDNTFLTAALQRPLDLGADITLYSTTKWIEGHHATIGGALVTRDEELRTRLAYLRKSLGCIQSPFDAWLTLQGLKTLPLRMQAHSRSALRLATAIEGHPALHRVIHPGLESFGQRALAQAQHHGGHGGIVTVEFRGGQAAATAFVRALRIATLAESLGGVESLATHPESMTHADVPQSQRSALGITGGLVRLSVGLEDPEDLIADVREALDVARGEEPRIGREVTRAD